MRVLVTGAARGLGRAMAEHAIGRGASVVAIDRDAGGLAELEWHFAEYVTTRTLDLADSDAVKAQTRELARFFRFDTVFLNAGISATGPFEAIPGEAYERLVAVNVSAPLVMAAGLVDGGAMERNGTIVFVSSLSHCVGYPGAAVYAATKDAVAAYAASVQRPFRRRGVRVATVFPGPLRTDHAERHAPAGADATARMEPAVAARKIWRGVAKRQVHIYPGLTARAAGIAGRALPGTMTKAMRRMIFEKLDRPVW